jgi:ATP-dependent DNA ligase
MRNSYPTLYKKTSTGKIQQWDVRVEELEDVSTIINNYGQVGGKIQESHEQVLEGKNIGKANATTAFEQACAQAQSRWEKQKKKGYVENIEDAEAGATDALIEGGVFPILAHKFAEQGHKISYPALAQPKLDGHRCIAQHEHDDITIFYSLWSRTRKPIKGVPHISQALKNVFRDLNDDNQLPYLDGELYHHDYRQNFEDLTSFIRQDEPKAGHEVVQYHVYDIPDETLNNYERYTLLESLRPLFKDTPIQIVETVVVSNEEELYAYLDDCLARGYEGAMVRNMDGMYKFKRSYDLQKLKKFDDDEFRIVDVKVGTKGSMAGKAVFVCTKYRDKQPLAEGETFDVKLRGNMDELTRYANDPTLVVGKILTVKFQGYTKYGKPRFPVGERFRVEL